MKIPRKPKKPLEFLLEVMNDPKVAKALRVRAAIAAAQYVHIKREHGGKRENDEQEAVIAADGRFRESYEPPRLVANG